MKKKVFKLGTLSDERAQRYGEFIWELKEENGDVLRPSFVVEKAKPKSSPIHDFFEWDDNIAGQKYREWQARYLLGEIELVTVIDDKEERIRAFHNIIVENQETNEKIRGYVTLDEIRENQNYLDIVLENAKREIVGWERRYSQYKKLRKFRPLAPVFRAAANLNV